MKKTAKKTPQIKDINRDIVGVAESRIAQETAVKEQKCRERLEDNAYLLRKPRNPLIGEMTPRDDADFLVPMHKTLKQQMEDDAFREYEKRKTACLSTENTRSNPIEKYIGPRHVAVAETIRDRRTNLDHELEIMKKVIEFKRQQILMK